MVSDAKLAIGVLCVIIHFAVFGTFITAQEFLA